MRTEKKGGFLMDVICVFMRLLHKLKLATVVLIFNASLNDVAPVSPILLSVD